jgi:hypothetical protein
MLGISLLSEFEGMASHPETEDSAVGVQSILMRILKMQEILKELSVH